MQQNDLNVLSFDLSGESVGSYSMENLLDQVKECDDDDDKAELQKFVDDFQAPLNIPEGTYTILADDYSGNKPGTIELTAPITIDTIMMYVNELFADVDYDRFYEYLLVNPVTKEMLIECGS